MFLTEEIKSKLTPEQLKIAQIWEAENIKRDKLMDQVEKGSLSLSDALDLMKDMTPEFCEHNRSIMGMCSACDEIERIINPDAFKEED